MKNDLLGNRFFKLVVIKNLGRDELRRINWECQCDCGNIINAPTSHLKAGYLKSCKTCSHNRHSDLAGEKIGNLLILKVSGSFGNEKNTLWECKCDCGNLVTLQQQALRRGNPDKKSCGCKSYRKYPKEESTWIGLYKSTILSAKNRNIEFKLTIEDFKKITSQVCFYCGDTPTPKLRNAKDKYNDAILANGIDRINNSLGYTQENSVACCSPCNYIKSDLELEYFYNKIIKISKNLQK